MRVRDIVIGFLFLVILIAGVLWIFRTKNAKSTSVALPTPNIVQKINDTFPSLKVPAGAERANLSGVSGTSGIGVATREKSNGNYSVTIMANLPTPSANAYYQATLTNGTANISLGKMNFTKSGYMVNFVSSSDLSSYKKVVVSLDSAPILEGSF